MSFYTYPSIFAASLQLHQQKTNPVVCFQFFNVISPTLELFTSMFERYFIIQYVFHLPEPPFSPLKIGWLEYDPFLLGFSAYFQGRLL